MRLSTGFTVAVLTALAAAPGGCRDEDVGEIAARKWKAVELLPPAAFEGVDEGLTYGEILAKLGAPPLARGSGLCISAWRVVGGREFWVGTVHCDPAERPIYAKFVTGP